MTVQEIEIYSGTHRISEVKIEKGFIIYVSAVKFDPLVRLGPISDDSVYSFYDFFILALHVIIYHTSCDFLYIEMYELTYMANRLIFPLIL